MKFNDFEAVIALHGVQPKNWPDNDRDTMLSLIAVNRKADEVIKTYARIEAGLSEPMVPEISDQMMTTMQDNVMDMIQKNEAGRTEGALKYFISIAASFVLGLIIANSEVGVDMTASLFGDEDITADDVAFMALGYENASIIEEEGQNNENN